MSICNTFDNSTYLGWINNDLEPSLQTCLNECPENYRFDKITHKCFLCDVENDYFFNDICYKDGCPEKTELDLSEPNSRNCACEELSQIEFKTGLIIGIDKEYPPDYFDDKNICPFIFKGECYLKCPDNKYISEYNWRIKKMY